MSDEVKVETTSEPSSNIQFGKNSSYRQSQKFNIKKVKVVGIVLGIAVCAGLLLGPPEKSATSSNGESSSIPDNVSYQEPISVMPIGNYEAEEHLKQVQSQSRSSSKIKRLVGLQVFSRKEKFKIMPGTVVKGTILTGASLGFVKAKLDEDLPETLLVTGTILIGKSEPTDDRIMIHFNRAITENKKSFRMASYVADPSDNTPGIQISLWERYGLKFGLTAGLYFVSGVAQGLQSKEQVGGTAVSEPTLKNAVLNGTSTAAFESANELINDYRSKPPKPSIKGGFPVLIVFEGDLEEEN